VSDGETEGKRKDIDPGSERGRRGETCARGKGGEKIKKMDYVVAVQRPLGVQLKGVTFSQKPNLKNKGSRRCKTEISPTKRLGAEKAREVPVGHK